MISRVFLTGLCLLLFTVGPIFAQKVNISIQTDRGERFTFFLNGEKKNKTPQNKIKLTKLDAPIYKVKVVIANGKSVSKTLTPEPGHESNYTIKKVGKAYKIILTGSSIIPGLEVSQKVPPADTLSGKGSVIIDPSPEVKTAFIPGYVGPIGCPRPINANDFAKIKKTLMAKPADEDRIITTKHAVNTNCFLASQVKDLIMFLSQDKSRVELAKLAYSHTYDIGNFNKVNEAFSFEASAVELNTFINTNGKNK